MHVIAHSKYDATYDTLRNTLSVKVGDEVDVVEVLEDKGATSGLVADAELLRGVRLVDGDTVGGGVEDVLGSVLQNLLRWHVG